MIIKEIKIQNFKSIKDLTIHCNPGINAFIGKNGTGKSAVFEAVNLLSLSDLIITKPNDYENRENNLKKEKLIDIKG
jgi:AAA15 family ATPase/GTPase